MMMSKKKKLWLYILYTAVFIVFSFFIFHFFYSNGKSLVNAGDDYRQAYRALIYYSKYLRSIFKNIFVDHSLIIPQWDFNIAEGSDIIHTFNTGLIGDPFCFFSFLFDEDHMYIFYDLMRILRPYCAGLSFIYLCLYFKKENCIAIVAGALSYSFCYDSISSILNYPFMDTPMVFLPLVIVGVEKIINNEKPFVLVLSVFISAISNFYFFYSIVILTITFTIVRLIFNKETFKDKIIKLIKIALHSAFGTIMAACLVFPIMYSFLNFGRLESSYPFHLLYPISSYKSLLPSFTLSMPGFTGYVGGYALPCLLAVIYMFVSRDNKTLLVLFICGFIYAVLPVFGSIFNGFSYPSTRWVRLFSLLTCYMSVNYFDKIKNCREYLIPCLVIIVVYYILCFVLDDTNRKIQIVLFVLTITSFIFVNIYKKDDFLKNIALFSTTLFVIFCSLLFTLSPNYWNCAKDGVDFNKLTFTNYKEVETTSSINDDSFWRYSGNELNDNESTLGNHSSTNFYWSVSNDYVVSLRKYIGMSDHSCFHYTDYNNKSSLMNLASVKYFLAKKGDTNVPYGYEYYNSNEYYDLYINKDVLPMIYAFSNSISFEEWKDLDIIDKQEALLKSAVLDESDGNNDNEYKNVEIDFSIADSNDIHIEKNSIIVDKENSILNMSIDYQGAGEYYLIFENLHWVSDKQQTWQDHLYTNVKVNTSKSSNTIYYKNPEHTRYSNRHTFSINLGYFDEKFDEVELLFPDSGEFTYDGFRIVYLPLEQQNADLENLKDIKINNLSFETNKVNADVTIDEDKIIVLSIPYSKSWTAYVDGKKVELLNANIQYMGLKLGKGQHIIELEYRTPLLKEGAVISSISIIVFIVYLIIEKKKEV